MLEVALRKQFDGFRLDVAFTAEQAFVVLFGPSGSGKSVTLQAIAGIVEPESGSIRLDGQTLYDHTNRINAPPQARRVGYVPQHYALFPHLTVEKNIGFGLTGLSRREQSQRIVELIELLSLQGLTRRRPHELSGGQRQRVALARAVAIRPRLLLLDEPFAALDAPLRGALRQELLQLQERLDLKILLVSHDLTDAFTLGQQILVYDGGRIIQQGAREEIFFHPATRRVAELVGTGNILPAVVEHNEKDTLWLRWQGRRVATFPTTLLSPGTAVFLCVRPTQILVVRSDRLSAHARENLFTGHIVSERLQGEMYTLLLRLDESAAPHDLEIAMPGYVYHRLSLETEKRLTVELRRQALHVMPQQKE
jgi:molybdate transport system ATP-binding protein